MEYILFALLVFNLLFGFAWGYVNASGYNVVHFVLLYVLARYMRLFPDAPVNSFIRRFALPLIVVWAKGRKGLCILSSAKKKPFLADPKFLKHKGFEVCDEADNGIQLWALNFDGGTAKPRFRECARHPRVDGQGYVLYYTNQCPFNAKYVPIVEQTARDHGVSFKAIRLESKTEAQNAPTPVTTYALFYNGEYLTNEQMNEARFLKLLAK